MTYAVAADQIWAEMADEVAILHLGTGTYFGLRDVGADIWKQLPASPEAIASKLVDEYEVDAARCASDVRKFLGTLATRGLVQCVA